MIAGLCTDEPALPERLPRSLRRLSFFPDPGFPSGVSPVSPENTVADLHDAEPDLQSDEDRGNEAETPAESEEGGSGQADEEEERAGVKTGYVYDEWNGLQGEYYRDWCILREKRPVTHPGLTLEPPSLRDTERIRNMFERIRPDGLTRERYLFEGDTINMDRLVEYLTLRRARIAGKENFYEKTLVTARDLAVCLLIDISGSTGGEVGDQLKILDVEKRAAAVLAEGLDILGDTFALFGFTGNGRENCEFSVFKDFDEEWDAETRDMLYSVYPGTSTRIGVALRHAGYRLSQVDARRRLILLVSDGKPMDSEYDPNTGYAYLDVRKACYENRAKNIRTFGIITEEESRDDLLRMFPEQNFTVLRDIRNLAAAMAGAFLRLAV
jgi:nitric oxide reductase activation protein